MTVLSVGMNAAMGNTCEHCQHHFLQHPTPASLLRESSAFSVFAHFSLGHTPFKRGLHVVILFFFSFFFFLIIRVRVFFAYIWFTSWTGIPASPLKQTSFPWCLCLNKLFPGPTNTNWEGSSLWLQFCVTDWTSIIHVGHCRESKLLLSKFNNNNNNK